ncbi:hypothetical protein J2W48_003477 [Flavobacterium piscis]|uniref:Uncharacterized protein n=1 Tax=Flavobacterium piscis TaxID=1114874 RepID=A0ABU1YBA2_9FLAO|nr:hypothetical protein [Flavobacterium piscis]
MNSLSLFYSSFKKIVIKKNRNKIIQIYLKSKNLTNFRNYFFKRIVFKQLIHLFQKQKINFTADPLVDNSFIESIQS